MTGDYADFTRECPECHKFILVKACTDYSPELFANEKVSDAEPSEKP